MDRFAGPPCTDSFGFICLLARMDCVSWDRRTGDPYPKQMRRGGGNGAPGSANSGQSRVSGWPRTHLPVLSERVARETKWLQPPLTETIFRTAGERRRERDEGLLISSLRTPSKRCTKINIEAAEESEKTGYRNDLICMIAGGGRRFTTILSPREGSGLSATE